MQQLGFRSVFAKLFASVMLALILFAVAMVLLTQLVHDKDAGIRAEVVATQISGQIDPFLQELNVAISQDNRLQARFMMAVIKKSFAIFDESLQAKMGLYDNQGLLLMQTDNSDLPAELPDTPSFLTSIFPFFSDTAATHQAQVYSSTGYTLLYESRITPKKSPLSAVLNLFTGTLLLLIIMAGVLWWIARSMTWRINHMSQMMAQLGDGDFSVRVNSRGNDEIALLAHGFNQAAQKIEHLIEANNLLLAHASHELRTPITRIRLQVEMMDMLAETMPADTKNKFDKRAQAINRDLSGLNDLVESILLVSRLDAGHAMQQVERVDFYDLVNQERQHYPKATLIGEHIVIDGQPSMLTHLIRNLLNNAMLHGVPPVTILLYGVQTIEEADNIPEYLLHSLVSSSFANYNRSKYDEHINEIEQFKHEPTTNLSAEQADFEPPVDDTELQSETPPVPAIFRNGETFVNQGNANQGSVEQHSNDNEKAPDKKEASKDCHTKNMSDNQQPLSTKDSSPTVVSHDNSEISSAPRREGLFRKHLRKPQSETQRPAPKYAVLAVIDEGRGIPEDKREEIFTPFVRLQQRNKGSGLGLSLVSQIVSAHQGYLKTDTINGHTRFLVVIPVKHNSHYNSHSLQNNRNQTKSAKPDESV